jgi:hypothetical protein
MPSKPINYRVSANLDWAICMVEATRGSRRMYWRLVKRFWELWT